MTLKPSLVLRKSLSIHGISKVIEKFLAYSQPYCILALTELVEISPNLFFSELILEMDWVFCSFACLEFSVELLWLSELWLRFEDSQDLVTQRASLVGPVDDQMGNE